VKNSFEKNNDEGDVRFDEILV